MTAGLCGTCRENPAVRGLTTCAACNERSRIKGDEIAGRIGNASPEPERDGERAADTGLRLLSISDLAQLPSVDFRIQDILPGGLTIIFGDTSVGKTFLGVDMGMCIATGRSWFGRESRQGVVVYVMAEGVFGAYPRVEAWCHEHGAEPPDSILFIPEPVNFLDSGEVARLEQTLTAVNPDHLFIDTLARSMAGGDENSAQDMGKFIDAVERLRRRFNMDTTVIHHTGRNGEDERGSSALKAAADASLKLVREDSGMRLECRKMKDAAEFEPWHLHLAPVLNSCAIRLGTSSSRLTPAEHQFLSRVSDEFGTEWALPKKVQEAVGVPRSSYYRTLKALTERGLLEIEGEGQFACYRITEAGQQQLVSHGPKQSHETGPESVPQSHTPLGVGHGTLDETGGES
jgi:hypothetical protein